MSTKLIGGLNSNGKLGIVKLKNILYTAHTHKCLATLLVCVCVMKILSEGFVYGY